METKLWDELLACRAAAGLPGYFVRLLRVVASTSMSLAVCDGSTWTRSGRSGSSRPA